jgi:hypothetical protein
MSISFTHHSSGIFTIIMNTISPSLTFDLHKTTNTSDYFFNVLTFSHVLNTLQLTRVNSTNVLDEGLSIGEIGRQMNSKVKLVEIGMHRK